MSGHNKNKGFSQTSKRFDGEIKAQHQQSRNKQMDHAKRPESEQQEATPQKNLPTGAKNSRA